MDYPDCHLKCNGMLNCQQLDYLLIEMDKQNGREETINFYKAMLKRNFKRCPLVNNYQPLQQVASMY